jgi:predicted phage baseplate assembly protein
VAGDVIINSGNVILASADQNDPVVGESAVLSQPLAGNPLQGTVALTKGSPMVTGTGTSFTTSLTQGQWLLFGSDPTATAYQVSLIGGDTSLTLASNFLGSTTTSTTATVVDAASITTLAFVQPLERIYDRSTVTVNANTVAATQGETMNEILGSGDATNAALQFTLKQSPLTYVSSPLNQGAVSTLQVWVNNMQWHEVDNFLDSGPTDRVFVTETDSNQNVTVQFGDGVEGERTPTGQMNIRAVYRKGIGSAGNVQSGQLSQALDRPQGLKSVSNPGPGTGGADPDTADAARASAPLQILTLGRVVSLEDYQNYALAFAGIAKALATWTWVGRKRSVFLTLAGANGLAFQPDDLTITSLLQALQDVGNPYVPVYVANPSYNLVLFEVGANVQIDTTDYDPTQVLAQVWQSLSTSFSFAQRQMAQGVAQSEVIAVIQQTPGVIAVELTAFNPQGKPPAVGAPLQSVLPASAPMAGQQGTPSGAEMLLIDPASQGNFEVWHEPGR